MTRFIRWLVRPVFSWLELQIIIVISAIINGLGSSAQHWYQVTAGGFILLVLALQAIRAKRKAKDKP